LEKEFIEGDEDDYDVSHEFYEYEDWSYPLWCLYQTCKAFNWLNQYEYLAIDNGEFHTEIKSRLINGQFKGMAYQGYKDLIGYYSSDLTLKNYWCTDTHYWYRYDNNIKYHDKACDGGFYYRCREGSCKNPGCILCSQLDNIQKIVFEKDPQVADIFLHREKYTDYSVIVRQPKPILHLTFDFTGFVPYKE
jgi:hypothetical protein